MILINGCSLTSGYELSPGEKSWAIQFADHFNFKPYDLSKPGISNDYILRTTTDALLSGHPSFVLIGWTFEERYEFFTNKGQEVTIRSMDAKQNNGINFSTFKHLLINYFYGTSDTSFAKTARNKYLLSQLLEYKNIPYLFVDCAKSYRTGNLISDNSKTYEKCLNTNTRILTGDSFLQFSHGYKFGPEQHPLIDAHDSWALRIIKYATDYNLV